MKRRDLIRLVNSKGQRYSDILGINVNSGEDKEVVPSIDPVWRTHYRVFRHQNL